MAVQTLFPIVSFRGRVLMRACLAAFALAGLGLAGCADAFTTSRTETAEGRTLLEEGEGEEASLIFANQVRRAPRSYKAHYYLGESRMASGRTQEAILSYRTALEVMPLTPGGQRDEEFRFYIVDALSEALANHDEDGSQLAQLEAKGKGNKTYKLLVAMTHAKAGRPDNALESFNQAVTLDRTDPQIAKQYGLYLESIAQNDPAEFYLRRAYRLNTQDEEVAAALRRLGIVPGPAILSATELTRPAIPLGPLPEVKWQKQAQKPAPEAESETAAPTAPKSNKTLN